MRICLYMDPSRVFRWHAWLAESLAAMPGALVFFRLASDRRPLPRSCTLLLELERLVYGVHGKTAIDRVGEPFAASIAASGEGGEPFDAIVDLAGVDPRLPGAGRLLKPHFNGIAGEIGVIAGAIRGQAPSVEVYDSAYPGRSWRARPAAIDRTVLVLFMDGVLSCAVGVIKKALSEPAFPEGSGGKNYQPCGATGGPVAGQVLPWAAAVVGRKAVRLLENLVRGGRSWSVAWRRNPIRPLLDQGEASFSVIPDDGCRYYADPFPFRCSGQIFLFVEEFPYATGRGRIAVAEIDDAGRVGTPRPIIEEPYHLSYPFVFMHDGEIWMIPESGQAYGLYLYRAEQFPYKWRRESCLLSGIKGYDATLLRDGDRLWLFVCERVWNSSSWDTLSLFYSQKLIAEWVPHSHNPVLFDAASSRSGGAIFKRNGQNLRPVQDCSIQYGAAISLFQLDALSERAFSQTPIGTIDCAPHGCHTYNYSGIEVIDVFSSRGLRNVTAHFAPLGYPTNPETRTQNGGALTGSFVESGS